MTSSGWGPPTEVDEAIKQWMEAQGWSVTIEHEYFDEEAYAWRHELASGNSPTLIIARSVIEDYETDPRGLVSWLDLKKVAREIARTPMGLIVGRGENGLLLKNFVPA